MPEVTIKTIRSTQIEMSHLTVSFSYLSTRKFGTNIHPSSLRPKAPSTAVSIGSNTKPVTIRKLISTNGLISVDLLSGRRQKCYGRDT